MSLRSPLGHVLGLGSAKEGVRHWWVQRLTSVALVPLGLWFLLSLFSLPSLGHAEVVQWLRQDWTTLLLVLLVLVATWHSKLGVQVVIEDYVHGHGAKAVALVLSSFAHVLIAAACVYAILKIALGSAA